MFVAGGLMWLNIGKEGKFVVEASRSDGPPIDTNKEVTRVNGWPFKQEYMTEEEYIRYNGFGDWVIRPEVYWLLDALVNLTILVGVWIVCDELI